MNKSKALVLSVIGLFLCVSIPAAQEGKKTTEVGGVIFADYFYNATEGVAPAAKSYFELTRLYLTASRPLADNIKMKAVLEGSQPANKLFIKNAFIEFGDVLPGADLRGGVIGTPWIGFEEKIWRHRFVAKTFADNAGFLTSADLGVGLGGKLADDIVDYDVNVVNGEGYNGAEVSEHKDVAARVSVAPLAGVKLHGYQHIGNRGGSNQDRNRTILGVSYEQKKYAAMGYYLTARDTTTDKNGFSVFGSYTLLPWLGVFGRFDALDSDTATPNNAMQTIISGVALNISSNVQLALDAQLRNFENTAVQGNNQTIVYTHLGVKY